MPKVFTSKTQKTGELGEDIATEFLLNKKHEIIERNFTVPFGEIDIVSREKGRVIFSEVKAVSCEIYGKKIKLHGFNPEEQFHMKKINRMIKTVTMYSNLNNLDPLDARIDLICVYIDQESKKSAVKHIKNVLTKL